MEHPNRSVLLEQQALLEERLSRLDQTLSGPHSTDSAEQAIERENDEVLQSLKLETETELADIRAALHRMDSGDYGVCSACGEEIQAARLEAMPWASRCIHCADLP